MNTNRQYGEKGEKQVCYFSIEFFLGRLLDSYLRSLGVREIWTEALDELGIDYDELQRQEHDLGLGNGGLGRLATCFLRPDGSTGTAWSRMWYPLQIRTF